MRIIRRPWVRSTAARFAAYELGRLEEAESLLRQAIPLAKATQAETSSIHGTLGLNLASVLTDLGEYEEG